MKWIPITDQTRGIEKIIIIPLCKFHAGRLHGGRII